MKLFRSMVMRFSLRCVFRSAFTDSFGSQLCKPISIHSQPNRGKRKKKRSLNLDAKFDKTSQEEALKNLYERNIMDRSHLENLVFEELSDSGLPCYENIVLRFVSPDLQRVESYATFFRKFCPGDFYVSCFKCLEFFFVFRIIHLITNASINVKLKASLSYQQYFFLARRVICHP